VTRVAREVGTEGKLGGQAAVPGVAGTWKDLTDKRELHGVKLDWPGPQHRRSDDDRGGCRGGDQRRPGAKQPLLADPAAALPRQVVSLSLRGVQASFLL
jgi:hypothetical protein